MNQSTELQRMQHIVIIGAGMASLMASHELLRQTNDLPIQVTIVEATNSVGGRVNGDETFIPGHVIDTGAELIHGKKTLLTDLVERYNVTRKWYEITNNKLTEEHFLLSHADGGPDIEPTSDGKYGMYYLANELMMYDDPRIGPLNKALSELHNQPYDISTSLGERLEYLSPELKALATASYGNTAGCCNLDQISLSTLLAFEHYWQNNEEEGDVGISSKIGMHGVVKELYRELCQHANFITKLNWKVHEVTELSENNHVVVTSVDGNVLEANYVIVTPPPPLWDSFMDLTSDKKEAISLLGMGKAIKCAFKLSKPIWPENVQSIVMADTPIPEMWFRSVDDESYLAIGFLTSEAANSFEEMTHHGDANKATEIFMKQMSKVLSITEDEIRNVHVDTRIYTWDHAYACPKVGFQTTHLKDLAQPVGNIHFAGEATNTNACCTVQAAMETGVREANKILDKINNVEKESFCESR
mmetsp:Transcript_17530/g.21413  ORF Transcript_17530/g.21413 Transcript_17530/m.21413 type:complete len:473 (-) Transcript_17530:770-2188(-)